MTEQTIAAGVMGRTPRSRYEVRRPSARIWRGTSGALLAIIFAAHGSHADPMPKSIQIPGNRIFPESITATAEGRLIIGSIATGAIYSVNAGARKAVPWIQARRGANLGVFGVFADEPTQTLWACWSEAPGIPGEKAPSRLTAYDLKSGVEKTSYEMPTPGAFCNDIATATDGAVYATDSNNMEIDRLAPGSDHLQVWAGEGAFGPKGGILDGISAVGEAIYVNALVTGKLFRVAAGSGGTAGATHEVILDRPLQFPDGMRAFGSKSVLVVEGGTAGRLSLIELAGETGKVTTIKRDLTRGPVSVAVVGTDAFVLEGQLYWLFDPDHRHPRLEAFKATAVVVGLPP